jgi:hypothetical protein
MAVKEEVTQPSDKPFAHDDSMTAAHQLGFFLSLLQTTLVILLQLTFSK